MALSDVTNCRLDINESRHEITYNDKDGKKCHYNPASAILTSGYNPRENVEYQEYENMGNDIIEALTGRRPEVN